MCVSSRAWLTLRQNNYLIDTDESNLWHTQEQSHVFLQSHLRSWQFTQQHIFATSDSRQLGWQAGFRRDHKRPHGRARPRPGAHTQTWTGGLSDQKNRYRSRHFYFKLSRMTTGTKPARISRYLLKPVHINPHAQNKKNQKKTGKSSWKGAHVDENIHLVSAVWCTLLMRGIIWNNGQSGAERGGGGDRRGDKEVPDDIRVASRHNCLQVVLHLSSSPGFS